MVTKDVGNFFHTNNKDGLLSWELMEIQSLISKQSFTNLLRRYCNILIAVALFRMNMKMAKTLFKKTTKHIIGNGAI